MTKDSNWRTKVMRAFFEGVCAPIMERKGKASGSESGKPNQNFYDCAAPEHGHDHFVVWWDGFFKQVYRLRTWIFTREDPAEPLKQIFADLVNYSLIGYSMLVQDGIVEEPQLPPAMVTDQDITDDGKDGVDMRKVAEPALDQIQEKIGQEQIKLPPSGIGFDEQYAHEVLSILCDRAGINNYPDDSLELLAAHVAHISDDYLSRILCSGIQELRREPCRVGIRCTGCLPCRVRLLLKDVVSDLGKKEGGVVDESEEAKSGRTDSDLYNDPEAY